MKGKTPQKGKQMYREGAEGLKKNAFLIENYNFYEVVEEKMNMLSATLN